MYNLAIFTSSFPYPSVEAGTVATGIVIVNIMACRSRNSRLKNKISWDISKVIIAILLGIN